MVCLHTPLASGFSHKTVTLRSLMAVSICSFSTKLLVGSLWTFWKSLTTRGLSSQTARLRFLQTATPRSDCTRFIFTDCWMAVSSNCNTTVWLHAVYLHRLLDGGFFKLWHRSLVSEHSGCCPGDHQSAVFTDCTWFVFTDCWMAVSKPSDNMYSIWSLFHY